MSNLEEHNEKVTGAMITTAVSSFEEVKASKSFELVAIERSAQIMLHRRTAEIDDAHTKKQLVQGAFITLEAYMGLAPNRSGRTPNWPANWGVESPWHKKLKKKKPREKLVMAAALILAEIDRLDRIE